MDPSGYELVLIFLVVVLFGMVQTQKQRITPLAGRVAHLEHAAHPGVQQDANGLWPDVEAEVRTLVHSGRKIQAIRLVRERTGLRLKEAKDIVDRFGRVRCVTDHHSGPRQDLIDN